MSVLQTVCLRKYFVTEPTITRFQNDVILSVGKAEFVIDIITYGK